LDRDGFAKAVIGIDQGAMLLASENYRSGLIWEVMKRNESLALAMEKVGFVEGKIEILWAEPPEYHAPFLANGLKIDGYLRDWPQGEPLVMGAAYRETGTISEEGDIEATVRFAWSREALYFSVNVKDDSVILQRSGRNLWRDDAVEIFIDPEGNGLYWQDSSDYQIGFRARFEDELTETWSWFQGGEDPSETGMVAGRGFADEKGYIIEGGIRWRYLGMDPPDGPVPLHLSIAIHDVDRDRSDGKLQWFFRNEDEVNRFSLGKLILQS